MIVLGALLVLLAIAAFVAAIARGGRPASLDLGVVNVNTTVLMVFLAGALSLLVLVVGLSMLASGLKRERRRRQEVKALRQQAESAPARQSTERQAPPPRREPEPSERRTVEQPQERTVVVRREEAPPETVRREEVPPGEAEREGPDDHFESAPRER